MESDVELATRVAKLAGQLVLELRESFGVVEPDDKARRKQLKDDADRAIIDVSAPLDAAKALPTSPSILRCGNAARLMTRGSRLELSTFRQLASLVRRLTSQSSFRLSMATDLFAWWSRDHDRQRWPARASRGSRLNSQMRE